MEMDSRRHGKFEISKDGSLILYGRNECLTGELFFSLDEAEESVGPGAKICEASFIFAEDREIPRTQPSTFKDDSPRRDDDGSVLVYIAKPAGRHGSLDYSLHANPDGAWEAAGRQGKVFERAYELSEIEVVHVHRTTRNPLGRQTSPSP